MRSRHGDPMDYRRTAGFRRRKSMFDDRCSMLGLRGLAFNHQPSAIEHRVSSKRKTLFRQNETGSNPLLRLKRSWSFA